MNRPFALQMYDTFWRRKPALEARVDALELALRREAERRVDMYVKMVDILTRVNEGFAAIRDRLEALEEARIK